MAAGITEPRSSAMAYFDGLLATDLIETADLTLDPEVLDRGGWWAVLITYEGAMTGYLFRTVTRTSLPPPTDCLDRADTRQLAQFAGPRRLPGRRPPHPPAHRGR